MTFLKLPLRLSLLSTVIWTFVLRTIPGERLLDFDFNCKTLKFWAFPSVSQSLTFPFRVLTGVPGCKLSPFDGGDLFAKPSSEFVESACLNTGFGWNELLCLKLGRFLEIFGESVELFGISKVLSSRSRSFFVDNLFSDLLLVRDWILPGTEFLPLPLK